MTHYLDQIGLAERWKVSPRTLERWRGQRRGPAFCRIGGVVRYRIEDVEAYETRQRQETQQAAIIGKWR
jgi:hypothetical protein